jgi:hypothetical protein
MTMKSATTEFTVLSGGHGFLRVVVKPFVGG